MSQLIPLIVILPLILSFAIPLTKFLKIERYSGKLALGAIAVVFLFSIILFREILVTGTISYHMGGWQPPYGIELRADYLNIFGVVTISLVSFFVVLFSLGSIEHEIKKDAIMWYYTLFMLLFTSMVAICLSNDIFNLFVFFEIGAISACGIISLKHYRDCLEAAFKYLMLSTLSSGLILFAIALLYMITGHLNIDYIGLALKELDGQYPKIILASLALFTVGISVKSSLFPLHVWLPDAHSSAPTPSSAVLSGLVVKVYIITIIKILYRIYGGLMVDGLVIMSILRLLSSIAILAGSIFAIAQEDIKRMLAYSTVAQIGYIFLGISLMSTRGMAGGILHIFNHAIMKSLLFLSAGAIIYKLNIRKIGDLKGIGFKMPIVMGAFTIGAMAMVGLPGFNGFISKLYLALGALDGGKPLYVAVILASSLLNATYYFPIVIGSFFGAKEDASFEFDNIPRLMAIPLVVLSLIVLITGFFPSPFLAFAERASIYYLQFINGGL